ncbi:hypothetical protein ACFQ1M_12240 [Sungkyunkwania multivorans]|uniref:Uncharacterized protein n=1 Tax=Sungkyunkwania multivorans TaxID=1173618 RepID=A0ABW3CZL2_9FLAO
MKRSLFILWLVFITQPLCIKAQNTVDIDGRLQPLLQEFFKQCDKYGIEYNSKLFQLEKIDIVSDLPTQETAMILGKVKRDATGKAQSILINWVAMLDPEILKVVAFHEFAHHFLDYKHSCGDCNEIMAEVNISYFDIARDWENQVAHLFLSSPAYQKKRNTLMASTYLNGSIP